VDLTFLGEQLRELLVSLVCEGTIEAAAASGGRRVEHA